MNEKSEGLKPSKFLVKLKEGSIVRKDNVLYRIAQILDFETAVGVEIGGWRAVSLKIGELMSVEDVGENPDTTATDLENIERALWETAEKRYSLIKHLVERVTVGRGDVEECARRAGVAPSTVYRWIRRYKAYGVVSSLAPRKRGWKEGKGRIPHSSENVIDEVVKSYYLKPQRHSTHKTILEIRRLCLERGIKAPSSSTIRARIAQIPEHDKLRTRGEREKAHNKFTPVPGHFPGADHPLAVVQIDHTPADIILVDDEHRMPVGRPYITLATDVYSRVITGYYLSFDPPSETSVAMCVAHSILPKEEWMELHGVKAKWPVWGFPRVIHVDNGPEFCSDNFQRACTQHGIVLDHRPVKQPHFGGGIERAIGTVLREIHDLPGTTFSSIEERGGYNSEKHAAITKSEFEKWLVTWICTVYHNRKHNAIATTPLLKWETGIFGNGESKGRGIPSFPEDKFSLLLDFLPCFKRTVQTFGVTIDNWTYYAGALRPWINAMDPETGKKRRFIFRRDPRDISSVWFFDPEIEKYFKVPFSDQRRPSLSAWENERIKEHLKKQGIQAPTENDLLRALTELRGQVEESKTRTKKARREAQRRKEHQKGTTPAAPLPPAAAEEARDDQGAFQELLSGGVKPYGEVS